jgi:hypothetical protein
VSDQPEKTSIEILRSAVIRARVEASVPTDWPAAHADNKKDIVSLQRAARSLLQDMSLPGGNGWRLLPASLFVEFLTSWAALVAQNKEKLDALRAAAGVEGEALAQAVSMSTRFEDYPTGNFDMLQDVRPTLRARLAAAMDAEASKVLSSSAGDALSRLVAPLTTLRDRLVLYSQRASSPGVQGRTGVFRDSTVENVKAVASRLNAWNLMGDERVALAHSRLLGFARLEASTLRSHEPVRAAVIVRANEMLDTLKEWGVAASTDGGDDAMGG